MTFFLSVFFYPIMGLIVVAFFVVKLCSFRIGRHLVQIDSTDPAELFQPPRGQNNSHEAEQLNDYFNFSVLVISAGTVFFSSVALRQVMNQPED